MNTNNLGSQLNFYKESKVKLLIDHQENRKVLQDYLDKNYEVVTTASDKFKDIDIIKSNVNTDPWRKI